MVDQTVIEYQNDEPAIAVLEKIPAEFLDSNCPVQRGYEYFVTHNGDVTSGIWDCTAYKLKRETSAVNEFMILLQGSVTIEYDNGDSDTFIAGESFVIPKGLPYVWNQSGYLRKYYVIFEDKSNVQPQDPSTLRAIRADLTSTLATMTSHDETQYVSDVPEMGIMLIFSDLTGQYEVGIWDCTPMQRIPSTIARSELMHILQGSGSITNADGVEFKFSEGHTFMVPIGMGYQWKSDVYVKKVFCSFSPK